jgi:mutator protein MutT
MDWRLPISVKGVLIEDAAVVLLENDRDEWELPGGRLEQGETPEACVTREFKEELAATVRAGRILDTWVFEPLPGRFVFIVTYVVVRAEVGPLAISTEHRRMRWWPLRELSAARMPAGYRRSIELGTAT